jgi:hypothetical protein
VAAAEAEREAGEREGRDEVQGGSGRAAHASPMARGGPGVSVRDPAPETWFDYCAHTCTFARPSLFSTYSVSLENLPS